MGARPLPKPSTQEKAEQKGKLLKEKKQVTTGNPTITSRENQRIEKQKGKLERNILFMIASGTVCQTVSHIGYGWCASLLTLMAMGVQGQEVDKPPPCVGTPGEVAEVKKGGSLANPGSTVR